MEMSNKEFLKRQGEEGKLLRRAFVTGYLRGISLMWVFRKREIQGTDNEKDAFNFGQLMGMALIILVLVSVIVSVIWIFVGG